MKTFGQHLIDQPQVSKLDKHLDQLAETFPVLLAETFPTLELKTDYTDSHNSPLAEDVELQELDVASKLPTITGIEMKKPKLGENIADEEIISSLKMMHSLNQLSIFKNNKMENVHISNRSKIIFSTHSQDTKIYIRPEIAQESFKNLVLALDAIKKNGQDIRYIDLSFKNKIIVQH